MFSAPRYAPPHEHDGETALLLQKETTLIVSGTFHHVQRQHDEAPFQEATAWIELSSFWRSLPQLARCWQAAEGSTKTQSAQRLGF
jgi:hypothetical protein